MVNQNEANLGSKIFSIWGSLCFLCLVYSYFLVPEMKGLTLEQVGRMFEETSPRNSSKWVPQSTFAADMGLTEKSPEAAEIVEHGELKSFVERSGETTEFHFLGTCVIAIGAPERRMRINISRVRTYYLRIR